MDRRSRLPSISAIEEAMAGSSREQFWLPMEAIEEGGESSEKERLIAEKGGRDGWHCSFRLLNYMEKKLLHFCSCSLLFI